VLPARPETVSVDLDGWRIAPDRDVRGTGAFEVPWWDELTVGLERE
jgi:hypothetical protein